MSTASFLHAANSFDTCGIITLSGKDYDKVNALACAARDSIVDCGSGSALVINADTTVGFTRSEQSNIFSEELTVIPSSMY